MFARYKYRILSLFAVLALAAAGGLLLNQKAVGGDKPPVPAAAASTEKGTGSPWAIRCAKDEKTGKSGKCEIFQRLVVKETGKRVVEFAVGFPESTDSARGVVVLPLGMLLTEDVSMQVDKEKSFSFKPRYCVPEGCYAFVNLNRKLLDIMRAGKEVQISFRALDGKPVNIKLQLEGFGKGLKEIG